MVKKTKIISCFLGFVACCGRLFAQMFNVMLHHDELSDDVSVSLVG